MKTSRWVYVACVLLVLALVSPAVLLATYPFLESLKNRLDRAAIDLTSEGFESIGTYPGLLTEGSATVVTVRLTRGKDYGLVAVCEYCSGLDLALYDEENKRIDPSDVETGNHPVVTVTPRRTGQYKLVLRMTKCSKDYCYHGIGVFGRSRC